MRLKQEEDQGKEVILVKDIEMLLDGNKLTMFVDLEKEYGISSSGKSVIIGST